MFCLIIVISTPNSAFQLSFRVDIMQLSCGQQEQDLVSGASPNNTFQLTKVGPWEMKSCCMITHFGLCKYYFTSELVFD